MECLVTTYPNTTYHEIKDHNLRQLMSNPQPLYEKSDPNHATKRDATTKRTEDIKRIPICSENECVGGGTFR